MTRRIGDSIHIGHQISVRVLRITDNHVRIGIVASSDVAAHRQAIDARAQRE